MLIRRLDAREPGFATEQRFGIALGAYILERVGEIVRNPREPLEIARDQRLRLVGGDFEPAGEAPARNAVEDREIHRLSLAARVAVYLAEQFDRRRRVDVLTPIGRASCRERVCHSVYISVVAATLKKTTKSVIK